MPEDTVINITSPEQSTIIHPEPSKITRLTTHYKSHLDDLPAYVLIFMLFMASSYFTNFFPKYTANLIIENTIARHILGYTILVTSISSIKQEESTISILFISFVAYIWCYLLSLQGPISFSVSILLLIVAYLLNRDRNLQESAQHQGLLGSDIQKNNNTVYILIRRICIGIVFISIFIDFAKSAT